MILDIPPHIEQMMTATATAQGMSLQDWALTTLQKGIAQDDEQAYYDWFYEHHYDVEKLDKAIKSGTTEPVPPHALESLESFETWLSGAKTA